ncbi:hypothetical protein V6O07_00660 [Arthrospira platensis SPKY2]
MFCLLHYKAKAIAIPYIYAIARGQLFILRSKKGGFKPTSRYPDPRCYYKTKAIAPQGKRSL